MWEGNTKERQWENPWLFHKNFKLTKFSEKLQIYIQYAYVEMFISYFYTLLHIYLQKPLTIKEYLMSIL